MLNKRVTAGIVIIAIITCASYFGMKKYNEYQRYKYYLSQKEISDNIIKDIDRHFDSKQYSEIYDYNTDGVDENNNRVSKKYEPLVFKAVNSNISFLLDEKHYDDVIQFYSYREVKRFYITEPLFSDALNTGSHKLIDFFMDYINLQQQSYRTKSRAFESYPSRHGTVLCPSYIETTFGDLATLMCPSYSEVAAFLPTRDVGLRCSSYFTKTLAAGDLQVVKKVEAFLDRYGAHCHFYRYPSYVFDAISKGNLEVFKYLMDRYSWDIDHSFDVDDYHDGDTLILGTILPSVIRNYPKSKDLLHYINEDGSLSRIIAKTSIKKLMDAFTYGTNPSKDAFDFLMKNGLADKLKASKRELMPLIEELQESNSGFIDMTYYRVILATAQIGKYDLFEEYIQLLSKEQINHSSMTGPSGAIYYPIKIFQEKGDLRGLKIMEKYGYNICTPSFFYAVENKKYDFAAYLLNKKCFYITSESIHKTIYSSEGNHSKGIKNIISLMLDRMIQDKVQQDSHHLLEEIVRYNDIELTEKVLEITPHLDDEILESIKSNKEIDKEIVDFIEQHLIFTQESSEKQEGVQDSVSVDIS